MGMAAGAADGGCVTPPTGDPTNVSTYTYGGSKIGVQWTNEDGAAQTQIGNSLDTMTEPSSVFATVAPGVTSYETETTIECVWWVRHIRCGIVGSWVVDQDAAAECEA